jgi:hypothetical protein
MDLQSALDEIRRLKELLDRDRTGLANALNGVIRIAKGYDWLCEGRGPYQYDDNRYRMEIGVLITSVIHTASEALRTSGNLANEAFHPRAQATAALLVDATRDS